MDQKSTITQVTILVLFWGGEAETQCPTTANHAVEFPTFEEIAGVSTIGGKQTSLPLRKPPSRS